MKKNKCFHCGLPILFNSEYFFEVNGVLEEMCCPGCLAVSRFIIDGGFYEYYLYRSKPSSKVENLIFEDIVDYAVYDSSDFSDKFLTFENNNIVKVTLAIDGITCPACTWLIERYLKKIQGVYAVSVNLVTSRAQISGDIKSLPLSFLLREINRLGYTVCPYLLHNQEEMHKKEYNIELKKIVVAGIGMMQVMMLAIGIYIGEGNDLQEVYWNFIRYISFFVATPVLFFSAKNIFVNAFRNFKMFTFGMDVNVSISLLLAYFASIYNLLTRSGDVYFDSICMFVFLLLISRFMEMRTRHMSSYVVYSLQKLYKDVALVIVNDRYIEMSIDKLQVGDKLLVKPGNVIPVDCIILEGISCVDESIITGEAMPVLKKVGSFVIGGSKNIENALVLEVNKTKFKSTIAVIIDLLDKVSTAKPKITLFANKIASYFIVCVLLFAIGVGFVWYYSGSENVFGIVLSVLVISCPCALSLATPLAINSSTNLFAKSGFLIKKVHVLETLSKVTDIVFDKTGTLTTNEFILNRIKLLSSFSLRDVYSIACSLESTSHHPIAKLFSDFYSKGLCNIYLCKNVINYVNMGVEGVINEKKYRIGKLDFINEWIDSKFFVEDVKNNEICVILADKNAVIALFYLVNPIRKNLFDAISSLKISKFNLHILSGDSSYSVEYISGLLGVSNFKKNCNFEDKLHYIKSLQLNGAVVMMIGDGINDSLAFGGSQISVAMGSGIDLAKINADAVLLNDNLALVDQVILKSKKTKLIILQNVLWALFYNFFGMFIAALGLITPYFAALGMSCSSLLVVLNSLRLKKL